MVTGWLIAMFLPYYCARLFTTDKTLIQMGINAIRVVMICFPVIGFQMVITNFFQCIGKVQQLAVVTFATEILRQLLGDDMAAATYLATYVYDNLGHKLKILAVNC